MQILRRHHQNSKDFPSISVFSKARGQGLEIFFDIQLSEPYVNEKFGRDNLDNDGLWDYDVAEVFIKKGMGDGPYLELQVSPLGQKFALLVETPRKQTRKLVSLKSRMSSRYENGFFEATFNLHPEDIPGTGEGHFGNLCCCLGKPEARGYYALNINKEDQPDYHRTDLFVELSNL